MLAELKRLCTVRGDVSTIYQKGRSDVPKTTHDDWLIDLRRAFLRWKTASAIAEEFWDAYEGRWPFQIAVVEMATVPLV